MPTGYTNAVREGATTFEEFVWHCASALFYGDSMPKGLKAKPPEYAWKGVLEARAALNDATNLTVEGAAQRQSAAKQAWQELCRDAHATREAERQRYEDMIAQVEAWAAPTSAHEPLKAYMLSQLRDSIEFDCSPTSFDDQPVEEVDPADYRKRLIEEAGEALTRAEHDYRAALERAEKTTAWLTNLNKSVKRPRNR